MFKILSEPTFTHKVRISVPINGGYRDETVEATFRVVDPARLDSHDLRTTEGSTAFLKDVLVKLDDIADADGKPLPWSDEVRDAVLCLPYARSALAAAYFKAMVGAREGN